MAAAGCVHSQGREGKNTVLTIEVTGAAGGVPVHRLLVVAGHAHLWSLRWLHWFALATCSPCKRCSATESLHMHRQRYSYGGPAYSPLTLPNNGVLLLPWAQPSSQLPSAVALHSQAHGTLNPSPSGCLHTS